jgi:V-type H+-transporting ATPase subunit G
MASQTQGIQQLLTAEKKAAEKVSDARKRKNRRLKQARRRLRSTGWRGSWLSRRMKPSTLDRKMTLLQGLTRTPTRVKVEAMNRSVATNKDKVVDIQPRIHKNYRLA